MRKTQLAILAVLASLAFPFSPEVFLNSSDYSIVEFDYRGSSAQALHHGGGIHAIILPSSSSGEPSPSIDAGEISSALNELYLQSGYSPSALDSMQSVHAGIASVRKTKDPGEGKCRILIGTDRHECIDFDSCQKSCYSVTSFCLPIALGTGRHFIEEIWRFENASRRLDLAYSLEEATYSKFEQERTSKSAEAYLASLSELNKAASAASKSQLYTGYSLCALPDYSLSVITNLQTFAQRYYENASRFFYLQDEAQAVKSRTLLGLERVSLEEERLRIEAMGNLTETGQQNLSEVNASFQGEAVLSTYKRKSSPSGAFFALALLSIMLAVSSPLLRHFKSKRKGRR